MWTTYSKKWGSTDPLDPVAPAPDPTIFAHNTVHTYIRAVLADDV